MGQMTIHVPDELEGMAPDLEYFVNTMVRKLHTNRHKGTQSNLDPEAMLGLAEGEMLEAWEALKAGHGQFEFAVECVDVANFVFLAASGALGMTRSEFHNGRE